MNYTEEDIMEYIYTLAEKPEEERTKIEQEILCMAGSLAMLNRDIN